MSQEETTKNSNSDENTTDSTQENLDNNKTVPLSGQINSEEIDNLPTESIGSYGRIEPLMNDETENPEEGDIER